MKVGLKKCDSYEKESVYFTLKACIDGIADFKSTIMPGSKILIKPNLLKKDNPEDAVTTHPYVVEAVAKYFKELDCEVIIADSPGGIYTQKTIQAVYRTTGMEDAADNSKSALNFDVSFEEVALENSKTLRAIKIIKPAIEADYIVSVAKLKTHGMMTFSGAVKNLYGLVPGLTKAEYHFKFKETDAFGDLLVDICEFAKPVLSIIDGIEGMEGNEPSAGKKRQVGLLMASENPYALDYVASKIIGIEPNVIPTIKSADKRGIFSGKNNIADIVGEDLNSIKIEPFELPETIVDITNFLNFLPSSARRFITESARSKPNFKLDKCVSCAECKRICPPQIITMIHGKPVANFDNCISCFCCHEICPAKAIEIKRNWLNKLLF